MAEDQAAFEASVFLPPPPLACRRMDAAATPSFRPGDAALARRMRGGATCACAFSPPMRAVQRANRR